MLQTLEGVKKVLEQLAKESPHPTVDLLLKGVPWPKQAEQGFPPVVADTERWRLASQFRNTDPLVREFLQDAAKEVEELRLQNIRLEKELSTVNGMKDKLLDDLLNLQNEKAPKKPTKAK